MIAHEPELPQDGQSTYVLCPISIYVLYTYFSYMKKKS